MGCNSDFSVAIPNTSTCLVTTGPFTGETTNDHSILLTGPETGLQIGTCDTNGIGGSYARISSVSASPADVNDILARNSSSAASGFVRYDALASHRGVMCVSAGGNGGTVSLLTSLRDNPGNMSRRVRSATRDAVGTQYRIASHEHPPETVLEYVQNRAPDVAFYGASAMGGTSITFGILTPWLQQHFGPQASEPIVSTLRSMTDSGSRTVISNPARIGASAVVLTAMFEVAENYVAWDRGERTGSQAFADGVVDTALTGVSVYAGALAGAKIGAVAGSWFPGAGNVVGAAAGLVIGAGLAYGAHYLAHHTFLDT